MSQTEQIIWEIGKGESLSSVGFSKTAALMTSLVIVSPMAQSEQVDSDIVSAIHQSTPQLTTLSVETEISEMDLFKALNNLYDHLLAGQQDLDGEADKILYDNLWELMDS
jgi:hypothetical protein